MNPFFKAGCLAVLIWFCAVPAWAATQLYLANPDRGTISTYDADTGALINDAFISGLSKPGQLVLVGNDLYVLDFRTIGKYNATTGAVINPSLVPGLLLPNGIAVSGNNLFISGFTGSGTGLLGKYDATTGAPINASFIAGLPQSLIVAAAGTHLLVSYGDGLNPIAQYDADNGTIISQSFLPDMANLGDIVQVGNDIWISSCSNGPSGVIYKFKADTGENVIGLRRPFIANLNYPSAIAVSGDNLFIASSPDGVIGKYNARTGAVIKASFISKKIGTLGGIAVMPSASSGLFSTVSLSSFSQAGTASETATYLALAALGLIFALAIWAWATYFRQPAPNPSAEELPQETVSGKTGTNPLILCLIGVILLGAVGYTAYQAGSSMYAAKFNELKSEARKEAMAEQLSRQPPAQPSEMPPLRTLPAILVDPRNFQTENNWLASNISLRIASLAHLVLHPGETAVPDIQVQAQVKVESRQIHLIITGFSNDRVVADLKPDFAWDPHGYAPLATQLLGTLPSDSGQSSDPLPDELTSLLQLIGSTLARDDVALSKLLQKHPAWAAAHEQAALLLIGMALRDRASDYTDYRPMLSRATAHLALAQALRGSTPSTWAGEIADAGLRALSGREVDAVTHLDALAARADCPEAAKSWITALRLRAVDDWRIATPDAKAPLLVKIAWFQVLNNNITAIGALRRLQKMGDPEDVSDWGHAALSNLTGTSVETGNIFCDKTMAQEFQDLNTELQLEDALPDKTQPVGKILSEPLREKLFVGSSPALKIIGPDMFKDFARRHLLMEVRENYVWLKYMLGLPADAEKFRSAITESLEGMRRLENLGMFVPVVTGNTETILKELAKKQTTWEPWEIADGKLPGNQTLANIHPDMDTLNVFYQDGLPFGTTYDLFNRIQTIYVGSTFHDKQPVSLINYNLATYPYAQDIQALAPHSYLIFTLDKKEDDFLQISKSWWDYNIPSIWAVEKKANSLDEEDYMMIFQKHALLEPDIYFSIGKHLRKEGKDDQAAEMDRKGFEEAYDQVGMSNSVGPLVDYYYNHGRKEEAEMVAKRAADVFSACGLTIYAGLLEKEGRLSEAEKVAQDLADRYNERSVLDSLYAAHKEYFKDQSKILLDKVYPNGLEKVTFSSFTEPPINGCTFTEDSNLLQQSSLQVGDVVVALDGYRVTNQAQYEYVRDLTRDPHMDIIIWRKDRYLEDHVSQPGRKFNVRIQTYALPQ